MLEHLRVERVPNEYILKRYTKKAKTKETFDRRDYKTVSFDGTSFLYQQNEVLQLAMKVARTATKSEEQRAHAKQSLQALVEQLEALGCPTTADDEEAKACPDIKQYEPDMTQFEGENSSKDAQTQSTEAQPAKTVVVYKAPPKSKTKGSGKQAKKTADYKTVGPAKKKKGPAKKEEEELEEVEYDSDGELVTGLRRCGICGKKTQHNARTCPRRFDLPGVPAGNAIEGRVSKKRKRICQGCFKMENHNVLTCPVVKNALAIARTIDAAKNKNKGQKSKRMKQEDSEDDEDEEEEEDEAGNDEEDDDNEEDGVGDDEEDEEQEEERSPSPPEPKKRRSSRLK